MLRISVGYSPASARVGLVMVRVKLGPVLLVCRVALGGAILAILRLGGLIASFRHLTTLCAIGLFGLGLGGLILLPDSLGLGAFLWLCGLYDLV